MEVTIDFTLNMDYSEVGSLYRLLGALSVVKKRELGLNEEEIKITTSLCDLLSPFFNFYEE